MRFGIREICDVVFRAKSYQKLGSRKFYKDEPVLYFDTLKTSSLEGAATTVYATGGRGNPRLIAWEGERTLTFVMEDALLSMESFSILSGAGLIDAQDQPIFVHQTSQVQVKEDNTIVLPEAPAWNGLALTDELYNEAADIFVMVLGDDGQIAAEPCIPAAVNGATLTCYSHNGTLPARSIVLVDYYVKRTGGAQMIEITADKFGGNYYVEASTLFRRESDGVDMPAEFIIPNAKVQSNFTFALAATGDPSTFTFTMDAFPDYTKFDKTHKVLAAIQVITDEGVAEEGSRQPCGGDETVTMYDSPNANVTAKITSSSPSAVTIDVSGTVDGVAYDTALFGDAEDNGAQLTLTVPVEADSIQYEVKITNPYYAVPGSGVTGTTKVMTRTGAELQDGIVLMISEEPGDITVELSKINGDFKKVYTIKNNVKFSA